MMHFFKIEGAVIAPDLHLLNFTNVKLPGWKDLDKEYTEGLLDGKYTWASKDGKRYELALGVKAAGQLWSAEEIYESSLKKFGRA
jgi:hypothetical protein